MEVGRKWWPDGGVSGSDSGGGNGGGGEQDLRYMGREHMGGVRL